MKELQCDATMEACVPGQMYFTESSGPDRRQDRERSP